MRTNKFTIKYRYASSTGVWPPNVSSFLYTYLVSVTACPQSSNNGHFELEYGLVDGSKAITTRRTRPLFTFCIIVLALLMLQSKTCLPLKCKGYSMLVNNVS
jgi:hypothetical protein